jgi:hypothetical protein
LWIRYFDNIHVYWENRCWLFGNPCVSGNHCWVPNIQIRECKHSWLLFNRVEKKVSINSVQFELKLESTDTVLTLASIKFNENLHYSWVASWVQRSKCNRHSAGLGSHMKTCEHISMYTFSFSHSHTSPSQMRNTYKTTYLC